MKEPAEVRAEILGEFILDTGATVRTAAKAFGISKSTVHTDVTQKLQKINPELSREVRQVLDLNKAQRHIRGGMATREKYKGKAELRG